MAKRKQHVDEVDEVDEITVPREVITDEQVDTLLEDQVWQEEQSDEEVRAEKAAAVAATVDAQVQADARNAKEAAIKAGKDAELLEDQVWEAAQDENPFVRAQQAQIVEVRKNSADVAWIKFQPINPAHPDVKDPFGYLPEGEFRAQFPIKAK